MGSPVDHHEAIDFTGFSKGVCLFVCLLAEELIELSIDIVLLIFQNMAVHTHYHICAFMPQPPCNIKKWDV